MHVSFILLDFSISSNASNNGNTMALKKPSWLFVTLNDLSHMGVTAISI